jgi:CheY-like chemotaxis protein
VFSNLLNNAARYTEPGGRIAFNVAVEGGAVEVRIVDSGIGIEPAMLTTIFELFEQADHSLERSQVGLGVGLTLAKRLTELHGGTLSAKSEGLGKGSEFIVRLPLAPAGAANDAVAAEVVAFGRPSGHRILIVDDNRDFAASLATLLVGLDNDVRVANDGAAGLDAAREFGPDVAFLDIGMPKVNGYDLAARLRRIPALADCRLVAITGWGQEKDRQRAFEAGFDRHLVKPVNPNDVVAILRNLPVRAGH